MKQTALYLRFDGRSSQEFNIYQINFENGMIMTETLVPSRTINEINRQNSSISDFYSLTESNLSFKVNLYIDETIAYKNKTDIIRWLNKPIYKELVFETLPENIYYVIVTNIDMTHNTMAKGYFTVTFQCNAPYPFSAVKMTDTYIVDGITATNFTINNLGIKDTSVVKTVVTINGNTDLLIRNKTNNTELNFKELVSGTKIVFDCYNHSIYSTNSSDEEIIINNNKQNISWITLMAENNNIEVTGNCSIKIYWQEIRV